MFLIISDALHSLTSKELEYTPKIILQRKFENFIDLLWGRLSEHIGADSEVQGYRRCLEHYNLSSHQTHIDEPAPLIKNYGECRLVKSRDKRASFRTAYSRYQFCKGTPLEKRLARGDRCIEAVGRGVSRARYSVFA
ncbi:hypothetical protein ALC60_13770 [Trachymyrmex zeteki]|uniref:Uncharacterized protein n=1 Tax=Mycetomoellerius zeteki TaxID=64791 RepID=A0A151WH98_9HYME|nr:hypothetical protein ALC60_13770 [Trachymyrmex zeteki]